MSGRGMRGVVRESVYRPEWALRLDRAHTLDLYNAYSLLFKLYMEVRFHWILNFIDVEAGSRICLDLLDRSPAAYQAAVELIGEEANNKLVHLVLQRGGVFPRPGADSFAMLFFRSEEMRVSVENLGLSSDWPRFWRTIRHG